MNFIIRNNPGLIFEISKLKRSLPNEWKQANNFDQRPKVSNLSLQDILNIEVVINNTGHTKKFADLSNNEIYNILMRKKKVKMKSFDYWELRFPDLCIEWEDYFQLNIYNMLFSQKLMEFNWKLFHGVLHTEKRLLLMKLSNGKCVHCLEIENVQHLFVTCNDLGMFWKNIENIIKLIVPTFVLSEREILLGFFDKSVNQKVQLLINLIITLGKYMLWTRRNFVKYEKHTIVINETIIKFEKELIYYISTLMYCERPKRQAMKTTLSLLCNRIKAFRR